MKKTVRHIFIATLLTAGLTAHAQQLTTHVSGEYADTVVIPASSRLPFNPEVPQSTVSGPKYLSYSLQSLSVAVPASFATLEPAAIADTLNTISSRGYARLGLMSIFNVDASAGYKVFDTDRTRLSTWMQYDAATYRGQYHKLTGYGERFVHNHAATFGATLHQAVGRESFVDAGIDYTFQRYDVNAPSLSNPFAVDPRKLGRLNVSGLWTLRHNALDYGAGISYHYLHISNPLFNVPNENRIEGVAFFKGAFAGSSSAGLTANVSYQRYSALAAGITQLYWQAPMSRSNTLLTLNPYYRLDLTQLYLDLGARLDFVFGAGKCFHIAPDVKAVWMPAPIVKLYASLSGGVRQNTLGRELDAAQYLAPVAGARPSDIPLELKAGVTIGSYRGLHANLSVAFARANNWLMPLQDASTGYCSFTPLDVKSYMLHLDVGYTYKNILSAEASIEKAPKKSRHAYYMWIDRATTVAAAKLSVRPLKPLTLTLGWDFRSGRAVSTVIPQELPTGAASPVLVNLGSISKLRFSASYAVTRKLTIEGSIDNILNRAYMLPGLMPGQGITGLIGASYQF